MMRIGLLVIAIGIAGAKPARAELIGSFGGGRGLFARVPHGWFIGADTGWAHAFGSASSTTRAAAASDDRDGWSFGARGGYQLASGVSIQARYDRLGVATPDNVGTLSFATAGVRYSFPTFVMPFVEALVGSAFYDGDASLGASLGIGASAFVSRHASIDVTVRDWLVDIDGIHHIPTLTLGFAAGFGG